MTDLEVMDVARDALTTLLYVVTPILAVGLIVGLAIAFFQSLTQLQEMTLTFVPKIIAVFGAILILMPYMGRLMGDFMMRIAERIVGG
ncbi:flagellar biosynthesis protein FliQ [Kordiimonas laminariae]|uniref:flagellar biosynthesis protein FliQ n=1 Tax=Kordiimonas laminariae TaxID=2917717 RepID=UPI001FF174AA|nr:flagellar biosynthesis protein FliQ [Kordiimonas laminariae]MCK0069798.1 flagellar biosynthesis protein FliQ [Kordiimonas laminariae]